MENIPEEYPSRELLGPKPSNESFAEIRDFVELHDQIQTSVSLLDSLESFLSTFQKDLFAVSGQISDLQDRSRRIDDRLRSRRKIEKPLASLISDICISPNLVTLLLETDVGEPWIRAIGELERHLDVLAVRGRVKAVKDMAEVASELKLVATTKLRAFFLAISKPIRTSMTTNMQVIQTSILLKYRSLFTFLQKHASNVASEIQQSYVGAARAYYETGFRRYCRSLGWIMVRTVEKSESLVNPEPSPDFDTSRLDFARIDGPGIALGYMGDDKTHKEPVESLLRSVMLVLMDNATAEYAFVTTFFAPDPEPRSGSKNISSSSVTPNGPASAFDEDESSTAGLSSITPGSALSITDHNPQPLSISREDQNALNGTWKQIVDPAMDHCQTFIQSLLTPIPANIPLLIMIRLTEDVLNEIQKRGCAPLESFVFSVRLKMWPIFQKVMSDHVDELKKYAEGASSGSVGGFFGRGVVTTDASVGAICKRYVTIFNSFVTLTSQEEETMIFSNLLRLRQELSKLIIKHTEKITDSVSRANNQGKLYGALLRGLSGGPRPSAHPKAQTEIAYWRERDEEARRRMISANQNR